MKKLSASLVAVLAFVLGQAMISHYSNEAAADETGIQLPTGQFSWTSQGSFALCLNKSTFVEESCSTSGVLVVPITEVNNGSISEAAGNFCTVLTAVDSVLPLAPSSPINVSPPTVTANIHAVGTLVDYDPKTGIGHRSATTYIGGSCNGASFNSSGATAVSSFTHQFVVTNGGNRIEVLDTSITNPANAIGNFSGSNGTELRQTTQNDQ